MGDSYPSFSTLNIFQDEGYQHQSTCGCARRSRGYCEISCGHCKGSPWNFDQGFQAFGRRHFNADKKTVRVEKWFGKKKQLAAVRTVCSHITNLICGVTRGYKYKMRAVYAHFPINCAISEGGTLVEVRNFLGEKYTRRVRMHDGVVCENSKEQKDELILTGNSVEAVSQSAALIQQSTTVKNKDIRKFLDGVYVSEKGNVEAAAEK